MHSWLSVCKMEINICKWLTCNKCSNGGHYHSITGARRLHEHGPLQHHLKHRQICTHTHTHTRTHLIDQPSLPSVLHSCKSWFLASKSFSFTKLGSLPSTSMEKFLEGPLVAYAVQPPAILSAYSHLEVQLDSGLASTLASRCKPCPFCL